MSSPAKTNATTPIGTEEKPSLAAWLEKHQKPVTYVGVGLAVAILAGWLYIETGKRKAIAANDALDQARAVFESGNLPAASTEFQRIAESFRGTSAGNQAELALNEVRLTSGQSQIAADELQKFIAKDPPAYFASGAYLLLGGAQENLKKFDEAAAAYLRAGEIAEEPYRQVEAKINAARATRLAGKEPQALEILRGVISGYPKDTPGVAEAEVRLAEWSGGKA